MEREWRIGGEGPDSLHGDGDAWWGPDGSESDDVILGRGGDDTLHGDFGDASAPGGGADLLDGGNGDDALIGGGGGDVLIGGVGDDWFLGGNGDDTMVGGAGDDWMVGHWGADILVGGAGRDTIWYWNSFDEGVTVDLTANVGRGGDAEGDRLFSIEDVEGSDHADVLIGDGAANRLLGRGGENLLEGRGGDDTLDGSEGTDTAAYTGRASDYEVVLTAGGGGATVRDLNPRDGDEGTDSLVGIERLRFSEGAVELAASDPWTAPMGLDAY